jgi:uncharacterized protein with HEPN domain
MKRDLSLFLNDIFFYTSIILDFTIDMDFEVFSNDKKTILAVTRALEIIGEASKHIPNDLRKKFPEIEWKNMAGMRNFISHEYFGIDLPLIWNVIIKKLPSLKEDIQKVIIYYKTENNIPLF